MVQAPPRLVCLTGHGNCWQPMKRLLFIAHRLPYPPDKGERIRAYHELKALSKHFRVTLAALVHGKTGRDPASSLRPCCERIILAPAGGATGLVRGAVSALGGGSITEGFFRSRRLRGCLLRESRREPFDLVFAYSSSVLPFALAVTGAPRVMDLVDVDSIKWASYAESAGWPRRWLCQAEARGVHALEARAIEAFDAVLCVSQAEAKASGFDESRFTIVGNGVDADYFAPVRGPLNAAPSIVFTGTMDYRPNAEAVGWFVRKVWPELKRTVPDLSFTIVGRDPTRAVRRLSGVPGVSVTGAVPDVRGYLSAARVAVAPLRIARGIQNKVLEAMAMGRAVVASPAALEGLEVTPGKHVLCAATPQQWRRSITELLHDDARRDKLGREARRHVVENYNWAMRMRPLVQLCLRLAGAQTPPHQTRWAGARCTKSMSYC